MRTLKLISILSASLALTASANAQFSVSGGGAAIGDADGGQVYPTTMPLNPGTSCVTVPANVTSITSIEVAGLNHTWSGDLQMTLADPNGVEHLVFLRPGFLNTSNFGNSGDFTGDYTFVESGGAALPNSSAAGNIAPGTYNQTFDSGGTTWSSGDNGINNTPLGSITGPQGDWCVKIYDWGGGDTGGFTGWTLNGTSAGGECYLVIGDRPGAGDFTPEDTTLSTQLNEVDLFYPVLLNSMPTFVIPAPGGATGQNGQMTAVENPTRTFAAQVVMFNPEVFPGNPEQSSNGILVNINRRGQVNYVPFGNGTMSIWAQTGVNGNGETTVTFPFTMPQ